MLLLTIGQWLQIQKLTGVPPNCQSMNERLHADRTREVQLENRARRLQYTSYM